MEIWKSHIKHVCTKTAQGLGVMNRLKYFLPEHILLTLYYTLVYPHISYCAIIWGSAYATALLPLLTLQKKIMRVIAFAEFNAHTASLFAKYETLRVSDIYMLQVLSFMYKLKNNLLPHSCMRYHIQSLDTIHDTRKKSYFMIQSYRTDVRKKSIGIAGPIYWSEIPLAMQNAVCFPAFKHELKAWLVSNSN